MGPSVALANEVERSNILAPGINPSFPAFTDRRGDRLLGKSYPVTAAQLLPVFTGFLAPIHFFFQLTKELRSITIHSRFSRLKTNFMSRAIMAAVATSPPNFLVTAARDSSARI